LAKPDKHPAIFAAYRALSAGESFVLVNDHDPKHLFDEFETDHPGSFGWEYLDREPRNWRIRITKLATTPLPRVLGNTNLVDDEAGADAAGASWKLTMRERDLDANVILIPPGGAIDAHTGPDLDVLLHVLTGTGKLTTERGELDLAPGALVWLPRRSVRRFAAGPEGLRYLTVHQRREALVLCPSSQREVRASDHIA
jgi:uncharacterized protein (DUF2249 family)/quercetin dioxygenase-like cupin family protein